MLSLIKERHSTIMKTPFQLSVTPTLDLIINSH